MVMVGRCRANIRLFKICPCDRGLPHRGVPHRGVPHRGVPHRGVPPICLVMRFMDCERIE